MNTFGKLIITASIAGLAFGFAACSSSGDNNSGSESSEATTNSYSGPGSFWTATLSSNNGSGTFTMERSPAFNDPVDLTVNGTIDAIPANPNYLKLSVTSSSGTATDQPSVGDEAYGFEIPGFFTLIKPLNSTDDKLLPMLVQGDCPTTNVDFNWIVTGYEGSDNLATEADLTGLAAFNATSSEFSISEQYSLDGTNVLTAPQTLPGTCSDGFMQIDTGGGNFVDMWLSASGAAVVKAPESIIVAMPAESFSATSLASKEFTGLLFNESASAGEKVEPVWMTVAADGTTASAGLWADVINAQKEAAVASLSFTGFDSPRLGFVQTALTVDGNPGGNIICQYKSNINNSNKDIMFCAGHSPGDTDNMFNILLISN